MGCKPRAALDSSTLASVALLYCTVYCIYSIPLPASQYIEATFSCPCFFHRLPEKENRMMAILKRRARSFFLVLAFSLLAVLLWHRTLQRTKHTDFRELSSSFFLNNMSSLHHTTDAMLTGSTEAREVNVECPTVHIAMVATGDMGSRELYTTLKSVFIHRSTPLHFHFLTDERGRTILQTMLSTWLLPGVSHDYYDIQQALHGATVPDSLLHCPKTLSLRFNLHLILPENIQHVVVIEPTSVVTVNLAGLWAVTVSREDTISLCSGCVTYCQEESREWVSRWGAVGLNLNIEDVAGERAGQVGECGAGATVDDAVMKALGVEILEERNVCEAIKKYNGELLRHRKNVKCSLTPLIVPSPSKKDPCKLFAWERWAHRRELPFLFGHSYTAKDEYDVSISTHLAPNRLNLLVQLIKHWDGPASVSIYVNDTEVEKVVNFIQNSGVLRDRTNVSYHLLFQVGPSYPFNHMRELGHRFVSTPYIFFLDVDYVASPNLYQTLQEALREGIFGETDKTAIVVPAFETSDENFVVPSTKSEIVSLFVDDKVTQFHKDHFDEGHRPTNYSKWITAEDPYFVQWQNNYEPYCILKTSVFSFDHRFVARFRNKCSHNIELHIAGYRFMVFPQSFVIHLPHPLAKKHTANLEKCSKKWYSDWLGEKIKQYNYTANDVIRTYYPSA